MRSFEVILLVIFLQSPSKAPGMAQPNHAPLSAQDVAGLQSAATAEDAVAQYKLALAYENGDGVPKNVQLAFQWCKKAAEQGNADAETKLGVMYRIGEGVDEDRKAAVQWYEKAAKQGNANAMFDLGAAYYNGDGTPIDDSLSYAWFVLARQGGSQQAVQAVARAESELTKFQIMTGYERLAELCENGKYLPENQAEAASWWLKAAQAGDRNAEIQIANRFLNGQGLKQDFSQARYWCNQAANGGALGGDPAGEYCLGYIYQHGLGVTADAKAARKWYQLAGLNAVPASIKALAQMDETGEGVKVDLAGAAVLYTQLAMRNDKDALQNVIRLKNAMTLKQWNEFRKRMPYFQMDPRILKISDIRVLAQIAEAGEGTKADFVGAAILYAELAIANDKDATEQIQRLKGKMSASDWREVQKRCSRYGLLVQAETPR